MTIIVFSNSLPMACVSFLYMVVWLASPIFLRCFALCKASGKAHACE